MVVVEDRNCCRHGVSPVESGGGLLAYRLLEQGGSFGFAAMRWRCIDAALIQRKRRA